MTPRKTRSVEHLQLIGRFEALRRTILSGRHDHLLDKPLAHWALPSDRRLPLALLGKSLGELLRTSYDDLAATPGVGRKKIGSLLTLLERVAETPEPRASGNGSSILGSILPSETFSGNGFAPGDVSEIVWQRWRETVRRHELGSEMLGRLTPSLKHVTRVVWETTLDVYCDVTLAEMREIRTHGDRRVNSILEVFYHLNKQLGDAKVQPNVRIRLVPRQIDRVETWIGRKLQIRDLPNSDEILEEFVKPLMEQVQLDAADQIIGLAESRLGLSGPVTSVRQVARSMNLTRARVYQLLNEVNDIMSVRWPNGRHQVYELRDKFFHESEAAEAQPDLDQFLAALELFYPGSRRGAAGPVDPADSPSPRSQAEEEFTERERDDVAAIV